MKKFCDQISYSRTAGALSTVFIFFFAIHMNKKKLMYQTVWEKQFLLERLSMTLTADGKRQR